MNRRTSGKRKPGGRRRIRLHPAAVRRICVLLAGLLCLIAAVIVTFRHFSYGGLVRRGYAAMAKEDAGTARSLFEKAIDRSPHRGSAYTGLAKLLVQTGDTKEAEDILLSAIAGEEADAELYEAAIRFYEEQGQKQKIALLLQKCDDAGVRKKLSAYITPSVSFSLEEGQYDEVQQVTLSLSDTDDGGSYTGKGKEKEDKQPVIYYTTDGSAPDETSHVYKEPILLPVGVTTLTAAAYNENGIPGAPVSKTYTVVLPPPPSPQVTPATGEYGSGQAITMQAPDGCVIYYTIDQSDPDTSSEKYVSPIGMPEGQTIIKAVAVDEKTGQRSDIVVRNYTRK